MKKSRHRFLPVFCTILGQSSGSSVTSKSSPTGQTPTVNDNTTCGAPVNKLTPAVISLIAMSLLFKLL